MESGLPCQKTRSDTCPPWSCLLREGKAKQQNQALGRGGAVSTSDRDCAHRSEMSPSQRQHRKHPARWNIPGWPHMAQRVGKGGQAWPW